MENFINVENVTYCGKEFNRIWSKDIYDIDLRQYGITFMDGVKAKTKIYSGEIGDVWQEYSCPFTPEGEVNLSEAFIEPVAIKVNLENCYDTFWPTYLVDQTSISLNGGIPATFADWFFAKLRRQMVKQYQDIFWNGDKVGGAKDYLKVTDGIVKVLNDATGATKVTGSKVTVDNVIAQVEAVIEKGIDKANEVEVDTVNYKIFMNHADVRVLEVALGKLCCGNSKDAVFGNYARENGHIYVMGYEVVPTMIARNTIVFGPANNLVLGFDTYDSHAQYKLIDLRNTTGDNAFRVLAISNIAVGVIFPELFVISKA